jgi:predicted ATPase with chaperone activity
MSDENNSREKSTSEIETKENFDKILAAIGEMRSDFTDRFDNLDKRVEKIEGVQSEIRKKVEKIESEQIETEKFMDNQFEAVRQGLVKITINSTVSNRKLRKIGRLSSAQKRLSANFASKFIF